MENRHLPGSIELRVSMRRIFWRTWYALNIISAAMYTPMRTSRYVIHSHISNQTDMHPALKELVSPLLLPWS